MLNNKFEKKNGKSENVITAKKNVRHKYTPNIIILYERNVKC